MTESDLVAALLPVCRALETLRVRYYLGGSLASSAHGVARASLGADIVAELAPEHVDAFISQLAATYYIPFDRVRVATAERRFFNLIHLPTMLKNDVFVSPGRPFDRQAAGRARPQALGEGPDAPRVPIASPEDTVLAKLEWFRRSGEISERPWWDIIGVLKVVAALDRQYLQRWALSLGVADLLERALNEAN